MSKSSTVFYSTNVYLLIHQINVPLKNLSCINSEFYERGICLWTAGCSFHTRWEIWHVCKLLLSEGEEMYLLEKYVFFCGGNNYYCNTNFGGCRYMRSIICWILWTENVLKYSLAHILNNFRQLNSRY